MTLLYWWLFYLKGGKPMETEVRAADGKKLFEWEPDGNVITIVIKQKKYVIKLNTDGEEPTYMQLNREEKE
jgi:hypothetical protein